MTQANRISDEELAAYLEGMLSDIGSARIDAAMDTDTFEILGVSRRAMEEFHAGNILSLPDWADIETSAVHTTYHSMAMAGFLGETCADDESHDGEGNDANRHSNDSHDNTCKRRLK